MEAAQVDIAKQLGWKKMIIPILLGLGAALYLLVSHLSESNFIQVDPGTGDYMWVDPGNGHGIDYNNPKEFLKVTNGDYVQLSAPQVLARVKWGWASSLSLFAALLMVICRDLGYMFRLRFLTDRQLSWRQSFRSIMLWEFASALTPSVVGGSGIAIFILNREGINLGKSTALVLITALLDELFYIIMVPIVFLLIGGDALFPAVWEGSAFGENSVELLFYLGYGFIITLTALLLLSVLFFPEKFRRGIMNIFSIRLLRRFLRRVARLGEEVVQASEALKGKKSKFWVRALGATFFSWTARFMTLNFILLAFAPSLNHLQVYGRQLVMWVIMLISPTPGSSGIAEIALTSFFEYLIPSGVLLASIALIWRLTTYFPYIFIGALILPKWLSETAHNSTEN